MATPNPTDLYAGVDVGALWTKAAVVTGGSLAGAAVLPTGEQCQDTAVVALEKALADAEVAVGTRLEDLAAIVATGAGKGELDFIAGLGNEVRCAARGATYRNPAVRGVLDLGAESTRVAKLDDAGAVLEFSLNEKCAAGTGIFLDAIASVMGVSIEEVGPLSLTSTAKVEINCTCVVFAESEVVSQVHRQTPKEDILAGIHRAIATRTFSMVKRVGLDPNLPTQAIGGLARNSGIVAALSVLLGQPIGVPERPMIVSALGAALLAEAGTFTAVAGTDAVGGPP